MTPAAHIAQHIRRDEKVSKLVAALVEMEIPASDAEQGSDADWALIAKVAECNPPDPKDRENRTKKLVVARLRELEMLAKRTFKVKRESVCL